MFILYTLIYFRSQGEECDDMNTMNGDGCSGHCKKEPFFNCVGKKHQHHHTATAKVWHAFKHTVLRDVSLRGGKASLRAAL